MYSTSRLLAAAGIAVLLALVVLSSFLAEGPDQARTPSQAASGFRFVAWGDTKSALSTLSSLSNQAAALNPDFTIFAGDLESDGFTQSGMDAWKNAMNGGSNNGMFARTFPVRGNHDSGNTSGWQAYYDLATTATRAGATNYTELSRDLTYSFDFGNSRFIGVDVLGDASLLTATQISWIEQVLADAESKGLTHAFIYFHGPIYCVDGHCSCTTVAGCVSSAAVDLIYVINRHPIVSATFHGHEHVQAYTGVDARRVPQATRRFEQFILGDAGAGPNTPYSNRIDYWMDASDNKGGFAAVDVDGVSYTVNLHKGGVIAPVKSMTFTKPGSTTTPTLTATPTSLPTSDPIVADGFESRRLTYIGPWR